MAGTHARPHTVGRRRRQCYSGHRRGTGATALMLRLPSFAYLQPKTVAEALRMKSDAGPDGMFVAGGTDLYPNMKRRHQEPKTVITLMEIPALRRIAERSLGACLSLTELSDSPTVRPSVEVVSRAAALVSTPLLRNM